MPEHCFSFQVTDPNLLDFPTHLMQQGRYSIEVRDGDVFVYGNRDGLLYLAEVIARCAIGDFARGFHVHLPLESGTAPGEPKDEIAIFAAEGQLKLSSTS
jgi:hypothetical protein